MAGEIIEGKRTLIEHQGREFELPHQHTVELKEVELDEGNQTWVNLATPLEGSTFYLRDLEERDDEVVVHLGSEIGHHGPPGMGEKIPEARGYPFPS